MPTTPITVLSILLFCEGSIFSSSIASSRSLSNSRSGALRCSSYVCSSIRVQKLLRLVGGLSPLVIDPRLDCFLNTLSILRLAGTGSPFELNTSWKHISYIRILTPAANKSQLVSRITSPLRSLFSRMETSTSNHSGMSKSSSLTLESRNPNMHNSNLSRVGRIGEWKKDEANCRIT